MVVEELYALVYNNDHVRMLYVELYVVALITYFGFGSLFLVLDVTNPEWAISFKVQQGIKMDQSKLLRAIKQILFNQIVIVWIMCYLYGNALVWRGNPFLPSEIYFSPLRLVLDIICILLSLEFGFYYSHRLCHEVPFLYKYVLFYFLSFFFL